MNAAFGLLLATLLTGDSVTAEVTTISGPARTGRLVSGDASMWTILVDESTVRIPSSEVLDIRLRHDTPAAPQARDIQVRLIDGSQISVSQIQSANRVTTLSLGSEQSLSVPADSVLSVRLSAGSPEVDQQWNDLHRREHRQDMLVVQKGETLDFVEGTIGNMSESNLILLLDGEQIEVPRDRAFGVIFFRGSGDAAPATGFLELVTGDRLAVRSLDVRDGQVTATLAAGAETTISLAEIAGFDLSTGKLTWLSSLEPRDVRHAFRFIDPAPTLATDRDIWGEPLKVGRQSFARGVAIRSRTQLRYRLNGDFSRFQAWVGIQHGYRGDVRLQLSLDGKPAFEQIIEPDQEPVPVDLDVTDRFNLEILVDYGKLESDIGDHLILGNARLLR